MRAAFLNAEVRRAHTRLPRTQTLGECLYNVEQFSICKSVLWEAWGWLGLLRALVGLRSNLGAAHLPRPPVLPRPSPSCFINNSISQGEQTAHSLPFPLDQRIKDKSPYNSPLYGQQRNQVLLWNISPVCQQLPWRFFFVHRTARTPLNGLTLTLHFSPFFFPVFFNVPQSFMLSWFVGNTQA